MPIRYFARLYTERPKKFTKRKPYACVHCGEPCSKSGHLVLAYPEFDKAEGLCAIGGLFRLTELGDVIFGFECAPGHTCLTIGTDVARSLPMTRPKTVRDPEWRDLEPTVKQIAYLGLLGYNGPHPVTRGQAATLITAIKSGGLKATLTVEVGELAGVDFRRVRVTD